MKPSTSHLQVSGLKSQVSSSPSQVSPSSAGRPPKGYFYRRYEARGNTRHASLDDPKHAKDPIWFCFTLHGWRQSINLHTSSLRVARARARWAHKLIRLTDEEKMLKNLARLGRQAEARFQRLLAARLEHSTKPRRSAP